MIEYTLLLAFLVLASAGLFIGNGGSVKGIWSTAGSHLAVADGGASASAPSGGGGGGGGHHGGGGGHGVGGGGGGHHGGGGQGGGPRF